MTPRKRALLFIGLFCFIFQKFYGQTYTMGPEDFMSWDEFVSDYLNETDDTSSPEKTRIWQINLLDRLEEMHANRININLAKKKDLLLIPGLNEAQADSILEYRKKKRLLRSLGELQWISGLSYNTRCRISLFAFAGDTIKPKEKPGRYFYAGTHDITTRTDIPLYKREGNKDFTLSELESHPNRYYLGSREANTIRYRYRYKNNTSYGLTLQKDSGEPFAARGNYPYDYFSLYLTFKPESQKYSLFAGDYNVNFGQGLIMGNTFFFGPAQLVENTLLQQSKIKSHTSSDEFNFLRGIAASYRFGKFWSTCIFTSFRRLDGRVKNDTLISFQSDGQHRSPTELEHRHAVGNFVGGGRISYSRPRWQMALSAYYSHYDKTISPSLRAYNKYYLRGKSSTGISTDYTWHSRKWSLMGETAFDKHWHLATTNTLQFSPNNRLSFTLQQHSFSPKFIAPFGNTLQELSKVQNEHTILLGATMSLFDHVQITSYINYFFHPRATFRAEMPSKGFDTFFQTKYVFSPQFNLSFRYKTKAEQQNVSGYHQLLQYVSTHRSRISATLTQKRITSNAAIDATIVTRQTTKTTFGWMCSSRNLLRITPRIFIHGFAAIFFTDDYASRLYAYEPQLQYAASFPTFAYHGARLAGLIQWNFTPKGYAALRYGWMHYFNRRSISSGPQEIKSSSKNDLSIQLGLRF